MKLALVCGDGLPVSGLLTVFRNVVGLDTGGEMIEFPIAADLGYSWRPDKPAFFPAGPGDDASPAWLRVTRATPADRPGLAAEWTDIRRLVARADRLGHRERAALHRRIEALAVPYERHFTAWLAEHDADWVFAVNMTLSDAVPVTLGLHRAAARRWDRGRAGGILFWDHDLFGSYAVHEGDERVYPRRPNEFTPLPGTHPSHRWAVVSHALAQEAASYPTPLAPRVTPNVLPAVSTADLEARHTEFAAQRELLDGCPVILAPTRVFRVKGLEIAVRLLAEVRDACLRRGDPVPYLLIFGDRGEDPGYSREVEAAVATAGVDGQVRYLDGVPLTTCRDSSGRWRLDEIDLLRLARATGGGVFFTPNRADVESVGLGPALAAVAGLPCAVTDFAAYDEVYGASLRCVRITPGTGPGPAAAEFAELLATSRAGDARTAAAMAANARHVAGRFPAEPWRLMLREFAAGLAAARPAGLRKAEKGRV